ncbi:MAG: magnesium and cobalt transport protein CorA [Firmicutes bacterium HGW-Firmicutes-8]|nr:MAG: magnesium and cobalt transport protein CorA [Firmicutes bacterium HGW-Firmicutes-8]
MIKTYQFQPDTGLIITASPKKTAQPGGLTWTDIEKPDNQETNVLREVFDFHPLAVEDCINMRQRAKLDDYKDYFFVVLHWAADHSTGSRIEVRELGIFVGHNYIVTFHRDEIGPVSSVRDRIEKTPELLSRGIDYILYLIIDAVIDDYFPILDRVDDDFSSVESQLLGSPGTADFNDLFKLRRALVDIRKILSPHREMINALIRHEGLLIKEENRVFYLDVYDHLMRIFDFLDTYRDLISGSQEIYLTAVSNKMNEVMKTLTVIATIVLPLTLISSIYGMNFRFMPELGWRYGYFWALGLMLVTAGGLVYYFWRKKWF